MDLSFTEYGKTRNNQLADKRKKDIENVLNDEFCSLDVHSEDNSCSIQNLEFWVNHLNCN